MSARRIFIFFNSSGDIAVHHKNFEIYLANDNQLSGEQARILKKGSG